MRIARDVSIRGTTDAGGPGESGSLGVLVREDLVAAAQQRDGRLGGDDVCVGHDKQTEN